MRRASRFFTTSEMGDRLWLISRDRYGLRGAGGNRRGSMTRSECLSRRAFLAFVAQRALARSALSKVPARAAQYHPPTP